MKPSTQFRKMIESDEITVAPGVHDPLTARIAEVVGFDAVYMTGWGTSVSKGLANARLMTMTEMVDTMSNVTDAVNIPVFADAEEGFGGPLNTIRTVKKSIKAGLAGIHLEDEKPPGSLMSREVLTQDQAVQKIQAATDTRNQLDEDFVIIARSKAHESAHGSLDESIKRVQAYHDAGADMVNVTVDNRSDYERVSQEVDAPLLVTGALVQLPPEEFEEMGVDVVMYALSGTWATILGVYTYTEQLRRNPTGTMEKLEAELEDIPLPEIDGFAEAFQQTKKYKPEEIQDYEKLDSVIYSGVDEE